MYHFSGTWTIFYLVIIVTNYNNYGYTSIAPESAGKKKRIIIGLKKVIIHIIYWLRFVYYFYLLLCIL